MDDERRTPRVIGSNPNWTDLEPLIRFTRLVVGADAPLVRQTEIVDEGSNDHIEIAPDIDIEAFVEDLHRRLAQGPAIALPSWQYLAGMFSPMPGEGILREVAAADTPVALLLPSISVASSRGVRFRSLLAELGRDLMIIQLVRGPGKRWGDTPVAVVLGDHSDHPLSRFIRLAPESLVDVAATELERLLRMQGGSTKVGFVRRERIDPSQPLTYERYDPVLASQVVDLAGWGAKATLGSSFDVRAVGQFERRAPNLRPSPERVLKRTQIHVDGSFSIGSMSADAADRVQLVPLAPRDVVVVRDYRDLATDELRVALIDSTVLPLAAGFGLVVLRPNEEMTDAELDFLVEYLRSPLAKQLIISRGSGRNVTATELKSLPLPVPDPTLLDAIRAIGDAVERLEVWAEEARNAMSSMFSLHSSQEARAQLVMRGRLSRLRVEAAGAIDDAGQRIRILYPFPLAYRWRAFEVAVTRGSGREAMEQTLECFEHAMAFCGCLAAAALVDLRVSHPNLRGFGTRPGFRTYLSNWERMLEAVAASSRTGAIPEGSILCELDEFFSAATAKTAIARLSLLRNDDAHLRRLLGEDEDRAVNDAARELRSIMFALEFLADYELIIVDSTRWDRIKRRSTIQFRALVGDHPMVPIRTIVESTGDLEQGSLYLRNSAGHYLALRPFLVGSNCADCDHWSTFYPDELVDSGLRYKSIERGHAQIFEDATEAFSALGELLYPGG